jgi:iron(II)-dependent oxidoreductase
MRVPIPPGAVSGASDRLDWKERARSALERSRARLLALVDPLPEAALVQQHSELMSPPVWDLAHVANYEEQWLLRALGAGAITDGHLDAVYDAFRHPRRTRSGLPLLGVSETLAYLAKVRERALRHLDALEPPGAEATGPLLAEGFVYGMVAQHEQQHVETLLATLQLAEDIGVEPPPGNTPGPFRSQGPSEVLVPAGSFEMGSNDPWAYDNERPKHPVALDAFFIDRFPVTNGEFQRFIEAGGYAERRLWSQPGWAHRSSAGLDSPLFWRRTASGWERRRFSRWEQVPPDEPVCHVCWYEAEAYARWRGRRLPTEAEWEKAAAWNPEGGSRRWPWGNEHPDQHRANLWPAGAQPFAVGTLPAGAGACGAEQLVGDVWEWTASNFLPYPGFRAFPYREYSEVFFGNEYKVLRGGAWTVAPDVMRNTFRNWDYPIRRQIFAGFRCCRDA